MVYTIDTSKENDIDWTAKGHQRIVQNVANLISTWRYEVGYDRTKGLDPSIKDLPINKASALYVAEVFRIVETYEPRAKVISVIPISSENGEMDFEVVIDID